MHWHRIFGCAMLAAVLFRLAWGIAGARTARFVDFVRSPAEVWRYVRKPHGVPQYGSSSMPIGHTPLGGLSILAMLGLLLAQTVLGLFAVNVDGAASGPWARWVSFDTGRRLARLHAANFHLLLALVTLHLGAIAYYAVARGDNLVPAMVHGFKCRTVGEIPPRFVSGRRALWLSIGILVAVAFLVSLK